MPKSSFNNLSRRPFDHSLDVTLMEILGRRQSEVVHGIEVQGKAAFRARTREALELLRLSPMFGAARDYIAVIRQGRRALST